MPGPVGRAAELKVPSALEDPIQDRLGEVRIMEDSSPRGQRFVCREDHGPAVQMPIVDDLEEHVRRVGPVAEVADLVDDEDVRVRVDGQDVAQLPTPRGAGEVVDERRRRREDGLEAVLDGSVGEGHGQVGLAGAAGAAQDQAVAVGHKLGAEEGAEQRQADGGLEGEVVLVDRLEKRKVGAPHAALDPGLGAVSDLLGHEQGEEVAIAQAVLFTAVGQLGVEPADGRQVQAPQEGIKIDSGHRRRHRAASTAAGRRARCVVTYSAPMA